MTINFGSDLIVLVNSSDMVKIWAIWTWGDLDIHRREDTKNRKLKQIVCFWQLHVLKLVG
uniref:Uncharacterized protein n=1 Tax=Arundo donax TaxID=35708 RepID=A0A0A9G2D3_ARUDO